MIPPDPDKDAGYVILKLWPIETVTAGGIITGENQARREVGIAWCYRALGRIADTLNPGDSVVIPQYMINAGLRFPGDQAKDLVEVDACNCRYFLPAHIAKEQFDSTCESVGKEVLDACPQILAYAEGAAFPQARQWIERLKLKEKFFTPATAAILADTEKQVSQILKDAAADAAAQVKENQKHV
jgi:hypothetical protein